MFRRRPQPFNRTLLVGMAFMAAANVVRVVLERHTSMPENPRDALVGVLFGVAIGCMVLGLWRMNHQPATINPQRAKAGLKACATHDGNPAQV